MTRINKNKSDILARAGSSAAVGRHTNILILTVKVDTEYKYLSEQLRTAGFDLLKEDASDSELKIRRWERRSKKRPSGDPMPDLEISVGYLNDMGNAQSALQTYIFLRGVAPSLVFLCGISGSLSPDEWRLGDVVVGSSVEWWKFDKISDEPFSGAVTFGGRHFRREKVVLGKKTAHFVRKISEYLADKKTNLPTNDDSDARSKVKAYYGKEPLPRNQVHFKGIFSWDMVLTDGQARDYVAKAAINAAVVEMEGAGFELALERRREELKSEFPVGLIFRGISDRCHQKNKDDAVWQRLAMHNATIALIQFLDSLGESDFEALSR